MSSRRDRDDVELDRPRKRRSAWVRLRRTTLASRLTWWYAVPTAVLLGSVALAMFLMFSAALSRESNVRLEEETEEIAKAIQGRSALQGTLQQVIDAEAREAYASHRHGGAGVVVRVLDDSGKVIASNPKLAARLPTDLFPDVTRAGEDLDPDDVDLGSETYRVVQLELHRDGRAVTVQVAMDTRFESRLLLKYHKQIAVVLAIGVCFCLALSYMMARMAVRPVARIAATADRIGSSNLDERIPLDSLPRELAQLANGFNGMLERLEGGFSQLSRFTADIAHELRTPLTVLRGEIEVALMQARSEEDYRRALESGLEEARRLQQLTDRLLFLARAENKETAIRPEQVDLAHELGKVGEYYSPSADDRGVRLTVDTSGPIGVSLDRTLFQSAVGNLVDNAIEHTRPGGQVRIAARQEGDQACVEIADTGCGIAPEHLPFICDRFFQIDRSRNRRAGHAGLGLALVKTIVELHGGQIAVQSTLGEGTTVKIRFRSQ